MEGLLTRVRWVLACRPPSPGGGAGRGRGTTARRGRRALPLPQRRVGARRRASVEALRPS